jgi:hypothetical protein
VTFAKDLHLLMMKEILEAEIARRWLLRWTSKEE